ncbi:glycoside hydrolase family 65 protein [Spirochaeta lutea]|uniref:glycoside hydrolase family 65 protein n=1 Tax=Spirochaeta lutea TaxID=1480694 RepID=UPI00068D975F|nr:glycosyl hydrolase family 65 protein [Spirochaeta lutea]
MKKADKYLAPEEWGIREIGFDPQRSRVSESLFSQANEYMGARGFFEEGYSGDSLVGSYVNQVFEEKRASEPTSYRGVSNRMCFMVNTVNWFAVTIRIGGEVLDLASSRFSDYSRFLDFRTGLVTRCFTWQVDPSRKVSLCFERFLSMKRPERAYQRITLKPLGCTAPVELDLSLDFSHIHEQQKENYWSCSQRSVAEDRATIHGTSKHLNKQLAASFAMHSSLTLAQTPLVEDQAVGIRLTGLVDPASTLVVEREINLLREGHSPRSREGLSFHDALEENRAYWDEVWHRSDIQIEGDLENQQGIRYCIFQLEQTYHGASPGANIGAKGLSGEAYNGNAFWDTEVYCLPYYLFSNPEAAKRLLDFRYRTLPQALDRAKELDCRGACYPVATIDGTESCTLWQHASLQFQPSTGVAYALWHYWNITGDTGYLADKGLEMLLQISRFLTSRVQWSETKQQFGFFGVMGPDEFQMMVNHNAYTNYMAKRCLEFALEILSHVSETEPEVWKSLVEKIGFSNREREEFAAIAAQMYIPQDSARGLIEQHEGFFDLPHIDLDCIPQEDFPLYHSWSYDRIYRNDMIKQPDVLMFMFLYNQSFTRRQKQVNYEYYEPRCIHESSLSPSVHSILAVELGKYREALEFFRFATRIDLDNYNRNTREGLHGTAIAGAWMNIVYGFGGFRSDGPIPVMNPVLPEDWTGYRFNLHIRNSHIQVLVTRETTSVTLVSGDGLPLILGGESWNLGGTAAPRSIQIPTTRVQ